MKTAKEYASTVVHPSMHGAYCKKDPKHCLGCKLETRFAEALRQALADNNRSVVAETPEVRTLAAEIQALRRVADAGKDVLEALEGKVAIEDRWALLELTDALTSYELTEQTRCESSLQVVETSSTTSWWKRLSACLASLLPRSSPAAKLESTRSGSAGQLSAESP